MQIYALLNIKHNGTHFIMLIIKRQINETIIYVE